MLLKRQAALTPTSSLTSARMGLMFAAARHSISYSGRTESEIGKTCLARQLPAGAAQHALIQLAAFLAARCGAEQAA